MRKPYSLDYLVIQHKKYLFLLLVQ